MAADRRHELVCPAPQRDGPALACRSGQPLARGHRQMDPRERRGAARRQPFTYFHWPAMDREGVALADPVGVGRARRRLGWRRRAFGRFDCSDLRPDAAAAAARPSPAPGAVVHRRRNRAEQSALPGASARFCLSLPGAVGRGPSARQRARTRAEAVAAAGDAVMGEPAWRLYARPDAVRLLRPGSRRDGSRCRPAQIPVRRMAEVRGGGRAGRLHHALRPRIRCS